MGTVTLPFPLARGRPQCYSVEGSGSPGTFAAADATRDQVRRAQRLRQHAVPHMVAKRTCCGLRRNACALDEKTSDALHGARVLNQLPLALAAAHPLEQRGANRCEIRLPSDDHEDRSRESCRARVDVNDIEARERDALQQHGVQLGIEARSCDAGCEARSCICAVAAHLAREHTVEPGARKYGTDDEHITAMFRSKRRVIESDDVRPASVLAFHGSAALGPAEHARDQSSVEVERLDGLARLHVVVEIAPRGEHIAPAERISKTNHRLPGEIRFASPDVEVIGRKPLASFAESDPASYTNDCVPVLQTVAACSCA